MRDRRYRLVLTLTYEEIDAVDAALRIWTGEQSRSHQAAEQAGRLVDALLILARINAVRSTRNKLGALLRDIERE